MISTARSQTSTVSGTFSLMMLSRSKMADQVPASRWRAHRASGNSSEAASVVLAFNSMGLRNMNGPSASSASTSRTLARENASVLRNTHTFG
ncbi:MAG: hypothetical protein MAG451_01737 [Anaerolineales bacterium]|nr:hypothetical protein [Anaerolineales bacterium]